MPEPKFVLPGHWWRVPTGGSETQLVSSIKRHIERAVGSADDRAGLRRDLRTQLLDSARRARGAGAQTMYLASELADGVPFPATLLVANIGENQAVLGTVAERAAALAALVAEDRRPGVVESVDFPLVRTVDVAPPNLDAEEYHAGVRVHYWLASPMDGGLVLFAFTCPFVSLRDQLVDLFDAIMSTVSFPADAYTAENVAADG